MSALYSCMSYNYEARQCISVKLFYQCNCCMQTNILFTARIIASMIYYIEVIVVSRPMIFHNYNTCTSLLQYACTHTYTTINTRDLNVNEWATLGGWDFFPVTLFLMTMDKLLTEMPFRDVAEIVTLDNE